MVSIIDTTNMGNIIKVTPQSKPKPKWKGCGTKVVSSWPSRVKSILPSESASRKPTAKPSTMLVMRNQKCRDSDSSSVTLNTVSASTTLLVAATVVGAACTSADREPRLLSTSEEPIRNTVVPATVGVKTKCSLWTLAANGSMSRAATAILPKITESLSASTIVSGKLKKANRIGPIKVKLVPCTDSNPEPTGPMRVTCTRVARPEINSADVIR